MLKGFVLGLFVAILAISAGVLYYFGSGMAPAAVGDPMMPFEKKIANMALDAHIKAQHVADPPIPADETNLLAAADVYKKNCASCHGLPNQPRSPYENTMFPKPTALFRGKGVTDDPPSESYWKAANGIRLSGMPAFKNRLKDTELWQVSLLVAHANDLPTSVKAKLVPDEAPGTTAAVENPKTPAK